MGRDIVNEIMTARDRSQMSDFYRVAQSLLDLERRLDALSSKEPETVGYFPVAAVAHLEAFFRHAIRDLLDTGAPSVRGADDLIKQGRLRFDSGLARALAGRKVTLGELIAASLSYSDLVRACGYVSALLGEDLLAAVRTELDRRDESWTLDDRLASLSRLYRARHIICHEARVTPEISLEDVSHWLAATWGLMEPALVVIERALYPSRTQDELDQVAVEAKEDALDRLSIAYGKLRNLDEELSAELSVSHDEWLEWAERTGELRSRILSADDLVMRRWRDLEIARMAQAEADVIDDLLERAASDASIVKTLSTTLDPRGL